jgi:hypothetical protein
MRRDAVILPALLLLDEQRLPVPLGKRNAQAAIGEKQTPRQAFPA